jgi:RNA polymerase sigma factor (TIGR02999 family)
MANTIGALIRTADTGDGTAADALFSTLYRELHLLAERQLRHRGGELTLGATTLLHETYLAISRREGVAFPSKGHFLAYAARAMRGLTIDYARRRRARKRGGEFHITSSGDAAAADDGWIEPERLAELSAALDELSGSNAALAQLVDLHFFCGFTFTEIAQLRGISERTVQREWRKARLLLHHLLQRA